MNSALLAYGQVTGRQDDRHSITGALYTLGSMLLVVKLGHSPLVTFYGGAGSLVLVLLWAYYASQIFLFGAAFIAVYASRYGSLVRPAGEAVAVHAASGGESADAR